MTAAATPTRSDDTAPDTTRGTTAATATPNAAGRQLSRLRAWRDDASGNTHAARRQRPRHHARRDDSACDTTRGATAATATPNTALQASDLLGLGL